MSHVSITGQRQLAYRLPRGDWRGACFAILALEWCTATSGLEFAKINVEERTELSLAMACRPEWGCLALILFVSTTGVTSGCSNDKRHQNWNAQLLLLCLIVCLFVQYKKWEIGQVVTRSDYNQTASVTSSDGDTTGATITMGRSRNGRCNSLPSIQPR